MCVQVARVVVETAATKAERTLPTNHRYLEVRVKVRVRAVRNCEGVGGHQMLTLLRRLGLARELVSKVRVGGEGNQLTRRALHTLSRQLLTHRFAT